LRQAPASPEWYQPQPRPIHQIAAHGNG
jgi:hypothetical protein